MNVRLAEFVHGAAWAAMLSAGCAQVVYVPHDVELSDELGTFEAATGGQLVQNHGLLELGELPFPASIGALRLDGDRITILPAPAGGKGQVNLHEGQGVEFTIRIAPAVDVETVCDSGESYGPFDVDFDTLNEFESVAPTETELDAATIALINTGSVSICIECTPEFAGTVSIEGLTLRLAP